MASGIARSAWTPVLAKSLHWSPQRLRALLNRHGYNAPYLDERRALSILEKENISTERYRKLKAGNGNGAAHPVVKHPKAAHNASWSETRLITRLAKLLPKYNTDPQYAKQIARGYLKAAGYDGPPWTDEERALKIFEQRGISTANFERLNEAGEAQPTANQDDMLGKLLSRHKRIQQALNVADNLVREEYRAGKRTTINDVETCLYMALNEIRRPL